MTPHKTQLKTQLQNALHKRAVCQLQALCLVNGSMDDIPDVVIHEYDKHCFIQTASLAADKYIPDIIEILRATRQPKSIWLKNHCELRQKRALSLNDCVLWGEAPQEIEIVEDAFVFRYPTDSKSLWPVSERTLRSAVQQWKTQNSKSAFLYISPPTAFGANTLFTPNRNVILDAPHWAEVCDTLRKFPHGDTYPLGVLSLPPIFASEKNKKALFHVLYQILHVLNSDAELWLTLFASDHWLLGLLQKAANSQKKNLVLRASSCGEVDFPIPLHTKNKWLPTLFKLRCFPQPQ